MLRVLEFVDFFGNRTHHDRRRHRREIRILQTLEQMHGIVVAVDQIFQQRLAYRTAGMHQVFDTGFHIVRMLSQLHRTCHPCASFDRMHQAQDRLWNRIVLRILLP